MSTGAYDILWELSARQHRLLMLAMIAGLVVLALLATVPRRRISWPGNLLVAGCSVFLAGQLVWIQGRPGAEHRQRPAAGPRWPTCGTMSDRATAEPQQPLGDPLSLRELQVLRLLDTGLSGPEIARHPPVSVKTLRTHTKRIFTKLDVTTRAAAAGRAHERGVL